MGRQWSLVIISYCAGSTKNSERQQGTSKFNRLALIQFGLLATCVKPLVTVSESEATHG